MTHGVGWGVRKVPKKCHVLFEWPRALHQVTFDGRFDKETKNFEGKTKLELVKKTF